MNKQSKKWIFLIAIGMNVLFWGMTLKSFGFNGDGLDGFLVGLGATLILGALISGKIKNCRQRTLP